MILLIIKTLLIISLIGDLNGNVIIGTKNIEIPQNSIGNYLVKKCKQFNYIFIFTC